MKQISGGFPVAVVFDVQSLVTTAIGKEILDTELRFILGDVYTRKVYFYSVGTDWLIN